jgi:hypothetical protein
MAGVLAAARVAHAQAGTITVTAWPRAVPVGRTSQLTLTIAGGMPTTVSWEARCRRAECPDVYRPLADLYGQARPVARSAAVGTIDYRCGVTWAAPMGGAKPKPSFGTTSVTYHGPTAEVIRTGLGINPAPTPATISTCLVTFELQRAGTALGPCPGSVEELIERPQLKPTDPFYSQVGPMSTGYFEWRAPNILDYKRIGDAFPDFYFAKNSTRVILWSNLAIGQIFDDFYQTNSIKLHTCCPDGTGRQKFTLPKRHFLKKKTATGWQLLDVTGS